jgi:hypothetical protein
MTVIGVRMRSTHLNPLEPTSGGSYLEMLCSPVFSRRARVWRFRTRFPQIRPLPLDRPGISARRRLASGALMLARTRREKADRAAHRKIRSYAPRPPGVKIPYAKVAALPLETRWWPPLSHGRQQKSPRRGLGCHACQGYDDCMGQSAAPAYRAAVFLSTPRARPIR